MADKGKGKPGSRSSMRGTKPLDGGFDASPGASDLPAVSDNASRFGNGKKSGPRNLQETKVWKDSVGGVQRFAFNYWSTLKTAFNRMNRQQQEELITRLSQIMTIGTAIITMNIWYYFMPSQVRVIAPPLILVACWWIGTKIVGPSLIARFDDHLHPEE